MNLQFVPTLVYNIDPNRLDRHLSGAWPHAPAPNMKLLFRPNPPDRLCFRLSDDGMIPNNRNCPLLLYRQALTLPAHDPAGLFETLFASNRWSGSWRDGIYAFHHYHSTSHEVLGVYSGSATVLFGGEHGVTQEIQRGDVVVIPAGVGHKNLGSSEDFGVVGAYPEGRRWDLCYGRPGERPRADDNIAQVPVPELDPVYGVEVPLWQEWKSEDNP